MGPADESGLQPDLRLCGEAPAPAQPGMIGVAYDTGDATLLAGAPHATMGGSISVQARVRNFFAASGTEPEFVLLHPRQRTEHLPAPQLPAPLRCRRHRLPLHGVHPRQAAHALLVELNGARILGRKLC